MKRLCFAAALATASALAASASAATYDASVGYMQVSTAARGHDLDLGAVRATVGAQFTPYLGVESEVALGVGDTVIAGQTYVLEHELAAYATGQLPLGDAVSLRARVGYGDMRESDSGRLHKGVVTRDSVNYGLGADWKFAANSGLRADYTHQAVTGHGGKDGEAWAVAYVRGF
ncbi:MAG: cell envelope biosis protein OmpA [Caulobacteraceae bacterium]|nr:cell envelope biosis protein OmpA [Caulobacteraceae bacterium]